MATTRGLDVVGVPVALIQRKIKGPGFAFAPIPTEFSSAVTLTGNATPHAVGSWTEVIAATVEDVSWLMVCVSGMSTATADTRGLIDVAYGAAASEVAKIVSIPAGFTTTTPTVFPIPIWVPKGTRVSARLRSLITVDTAIIRIAPMREPRAGFKAATYVDTIGADTANSKGTNLPTSDTYVQLTAATTAPYRALILAPCGGSGATYASESSLYTLAVGPSGAEVAIGTAMATTTSSEIMYIEGSVPICAGHFPIGTRIAVKQSVGRTYRDAIVFGIPYA